MYHSKIFKIVLLLASLLSIQSLATEKLMSDDQVKDEIIDNYVTKHLKKKGPCPCPYNKSKDGKSCGARSAWSRKNNKDVICYRSDVTNEMVEKWREANKLKAPVKELELDNKKVNEEVTVKEFDAKEVTVKEEVEE